MNYRLFIFFILELMCCLVYAQQPEKKIIIIGVITNKENIPLINATVINSSNRTGTITNKNGTYQLIASKTPSTITISYLGYKTFAKKITQEIINNLITDTIRIDAVMDIEISELNTLEISSNSIKLLYDKPGIDILDFEFSNDNILLLISENKKTKLRLVNSNADIIITNVTLKFNGDKFYKDCFDGIHILSEDSTFQVLVSGSEIYIYKGISIKKFNSILLPSVASTTNLLFLQTFGLYNQSVIYSVVNKATKQQQLLRNIRNAVTENFAKGELQKVEELKYQEIGRFDESFFRPDWEAENREWFYQNILSKQTYNPLKQLRDSIFIFDHIVDTIFVYNAQALLQRAFSITYHYENGWKSDIIIDQLKQNAYAKFMKDGIVYLKQINLIDGTILKTYKISQHTFPDKTKIKDNYVYYLYMSKDNYLPRKQLFVKRLD